MAINHVFFPIAAGIFRIFVPNQFLAGISYADQIDPSVLVYIHTEVQERIAECSIRQKYFRAGDLVPCPLGRLKPETARHNIQLAVVVDISHSDTLGNKVTRDYNFPEPDGIRFGLAGTISSGETEKEST